MGAEHPTLGPTGETVRANIRALRAARRLSQADVAAKATAAGRPCRRVMIAKIELGYRRVDVDDLTALAAALGVRPEQLLTAYVCERCNGKPPAGFTCRECGKEGA
jgi:transcriptional regulator with XRE-family HTH domain